jgi:hypothetical protein
MDSMLKEFCVMDDRFKEILATWAAENERAERLKRKRERQASALSRSFQVHRQDL